MKNYKVKIRKETPFDKEGTILSIQEFRIKYDYICIKSVDDEELFAYLLGEFKLAQCENVAGNHIGNWFMPIVENYNNFSIGDWIWHENNRVAYLIAPYSSGKEWLPNHCTLEAANNYTDIYKRKATSSEIHSAELLKVLNGSVLIGRDKCYYFHNTFKELKFVHSLVSDYIKKTNYLGKFTMLKVPNERLTGWNVQFTGLKVGCEHISHEEIISVAKFLEIIP